MKHSQINNLKPATTNYLEEIETNMMVVLCFISENIPCETVNVEGLPDDCEVTLVELSIKNWKWLCIGLHKPPSQNDKHFLENMSFAPTKISCGYGDLILIGDFNLTVENKNLSFHECIRFGMLHQKIYLLSIY